LPKDLQYGFFAQEVVNVFPGIVMNGSLPPKIDSTGNVLVPAKNICMIDYTRMVPILFAGQKEQKSIIDSLNIRLLKLEAQIASCCPQPLNLKKEFQTTDLVKLEQEIILYQNEPNPFSTSTIIRYYIPQRMDKAKITLQDLMGRTINEVYITQFGQGSISIETGQYKAGIYSYTLIVNESIIETKKMLKQ